MVKAGLFLKDANIIKSSNLIEKPEVSVILPTYCRGNNGLLKRAIESVLNQSFNKLELIIVDDGSVDHTREVVTEYIKNDSRVVYIRNDVNSGLPGLRVNQGVMYSRGKYIAYQFDDDQWTRDGLQNLYNEIIKHSDDCVVYGRCEYIDVITKIGGHLGCEKFSYDKIVYTNFIANNSVLHSKQLMYDYGGYDCHLTMRRLCDWDLWYRWAKEGVSFINLDETVSIVECNQEQSMFQLCFYDLALYRYIQSQERNNKLIINRLHEYEIDNLDFIQDDKLKEKVYFENILPWYVDKRSLISEEPILEYNKNKKLNILVIKSSYDATTDICVTNFLKVLNNRYNMIYMPIYQLNENMINYADIVIFQRAFAGLDENIINKLKEKVFIYMLDDDLLNLYTFDSVKFKELLPDTQNYQRLIQYISTANLVVCFSEAIKKEVRVYNSNVFLLNTNIMNKYLANKNYKNNEKLKIAFCGGDSRKEELDFIWDDILYISKKYKDKVEFYFYGYKPTKINTIKDSCVYTKEFNFNYYEYLNQLHKESFDIFLAPLFNGGIKNSKSPIKYLEAAVCGSIGIYSDSNVYKCIKDGFNGYKVKNEKGQWAEKIEYVINLDNERKKHIITNSINDIKERYTTESQTDLFELSLELAKLYKYLETKGRICFLIDDYFSNTIYIENTIKILKNYNINMCVCHFGKDDNEHIKEICYLNGVEYYMENLDLHLYDVDEKKFINSINKFFIDKSIKYINLCYTSYVIEKSLENIFMPFTTINMVEKYCNLNLDKNLNDPGLARDMLEIFNKYIHKANVDNKLLSRNSFNYETNGRTFQNKNNANVEWQQKNMSKDAKEINMPIYNFKNKFIYKVPLDTLIGFRLKCNYGLEKEELVIVIRAVKRKKHILREMRCVIENKNYNNFYFDLPLLSTQNNELVVELKSCNNRNTCKIEGMEGIYRFA